MNKYSVLLSIAALPLLASLKPNEAHAADPYISGIQASSTSTKAVYAKSNSNGFMSMTADVENQTVGGYFKGTGVPVIFYNIDVLTNSFTVYIGGYLVTFVSDSSGSTGTLTVQDMGESGGPIDSISGLMPSTLNNYSSSYTAAALKFSQFISYENAVNDVDSHLTAYQLNVDELPIEAQWSCITAGIAFGLVTVGTIVATAAAIVGIASIPGVNAWGATGGGLFVAGMAAVVILHTGDWWAGKCQL